MLPNRVEHVLADLGALHAGAVPVTLYATFAPDQVAYVAADCAARVAVLDGADQLSRWQPVLERMPRLHKIIVLDAAGWASDELYMTWAEFERLGAEQYAADPAAVAGRVAAIAPDDPVTLLYTSGTTGNPKGVVNTHRNVLFETGSLHVAGTRARGNPVDLLPAARAHRGAGADDLPADPRGRAHLLLPGSEGSSRHAAGRCSRPRCSVCRGSGRRCRPGSWR